jgi:hypothetical protein
MDVIGSAPKGPPRPPRPRRGGWQAGAARLGSLASIRRRGALGIAAVLGAGVLLTLRSAAEPVPPATPDRPARASASPAADLEPRLSRPFDRLPGRTPIPAPRLDRGSLRGRLPAVGGPGRSAAEQSAALVLGRFCRDLERYALSVDGAAGWRSAVAYAFRLDRSYDPLAVRLRLAWTGRAYEWSGSPAQLLSC